MHPCKRTVTQKPYNTVREERSNFLVNMIHKYNTYSLFVCVCVCVCKHYYKPIYYVKFKNKRYVRTSGIGNTRRVVANSGESFMMSCLTQDNNLQIHGKYSNNSFYSRHIENMQETRAEKILE
jgi:hypothetical protein